MFQKSESSRLSEASNSKRSSRRLSQAAVMETLEDRQLMSSVTSNITAPVSWHAYTHVTAAQLASDVKSQDARIIDLKVETASPLRFSAVLVHNTGPYASHWWWYYGQTAAQVQESVNSLHAQIVSLDPYVVNGKTYFATLFVPYGGTGKQSFWYGYGMSLSAIGTHLQQDDERLVDLEPYTVAGKTEYAAVAVPNTGANAETWYWYAGIAPSSINSLLAKDDSRIVDMTREPDGTFDLILEKNQGVAWKYYYGDSLAELVTLADQNHERIFDLDTYSVNGQSLHSAVMVSNSD